MGGSVSQVFRSGSALLSHNRDKVSKTTEEKIHEVFQILRANPKISLQCIESLLLQIPKVCNLQLVIFIVAVLTIFIDRMKAFWPFMMIVAITFCNAVWD